MQEYRCLQVLNNAMHRIFLPLVLVRNFLAAIRELNCSKVLLLGGSHGIFTLAVTKTGTDTGNGLLL